MSRSVDEHITMRPFLMEFLIEIGLKPRPTRSRQREEDINERGKAHVKRERPAQESGSVLVED